MPAKEPTLYEGVEVIRRIQQLMVVCSLLPNDGRLREVLRAALDLPGEPLLARTPPVTDLHPHSLKGWLESVWLSDSLTPEEKALVDWQSDSDNMSAAMRELDEVERAIGARLSIALDDPESR
ncbi:DurN family substrate-assisted peptide maturase [Nocardiopsis potens]|uniref:DurN family substrate-assisted peptide maturase n=1 Tax=Nocardiopsis potens TaxID=1246458 RepID=UPI0003737BA1|nr:DurN family substrate-assisted peptide maturase [Nocardiopsis potens]